MTASEGDVFWLAVHVLHSYFLVKCKEAWVLPYNLFHEDPIIDASFGNIIRGLRQCFTNSIRVKILIKFKSKLLSDKISNENLKIEQYTEGKIDTLRLCIISLSIQKIKFFLLKELIGASPI